jgi:ABC-type glycerol-3-phosphate transport system permease component
LTTNTQLTRDGAVPNATPGVTVRSRLARFTKHAILVTLSVAIILPLLWVLLLSLKTVQDGYQNEIWPAHGFHLDNYLYAWQNIPTLPRNVLNSVIVTVSSVALTTIAAVLGAYALVHLRTPGKTLVFALLVGSLFFPVRVTGLIGIWEIQRNLDLLNTTWGLVLPYVGALPSLALGIFVMRGIFQSIPRELAQAATIDGAGPWRILWYVMLPLVRNGIIVVVLFAFVTAWGEYLMVATLTSDVEKRTLPLVLATATGGMGQWAWPRIAAVYITAIVPAFIVFAMVQRQYLEGIQQGALKE